jgi:hypothetical protein
MIIESIFSLHGDQHRGRRSLFILHVVMQGCVLAPVNVVEWPGQR